MKQRKQLLETSKIYTPSHRNLHKYLTYLEEENKIERVEISENFLEAISIKDIKRWILGTEKVSEDFQNYSIKQLSGILLQKLEYNQQIQINIWNEFLETNNDLEKIKNFIKDLKEIPFDHSVNTVWYHIAKSVLIIHEGGLKTVDDELIRLGVFWLLNTTYNHKKVNIHYLSDTLKDWDTTNSRILERYRVLENLFWVQIGIDSLGSTPGRSFHTGSQVIQIIGQSAEIYMEKHQMNKAKKLYFMVNNADRSKHRKKEKAQGSHCLWARVKDPKTHITHDVIGVDDEVFSTFGEHIVEFYLVHGIPGDPHFEDLSKGTQFRSMHNFPYVQMLNAVSGGWCPAGFRVEKIEKDEYLNRLELEDNELLLVDKDHYLNGKCLSTQTNWVLSLAESLWAKMDEESLIAQCFHPDTNEIVQTLSLIPTEFLWKHPWRFCLWNGSSRGLNGQILIEIGKSKGHAEDEAGFIRKLPMGTRIQIKKA